MNKESSIIEITQINVVFNTVLIVSDPRTKTWFLVAKPYQGLCVIGLYLLFVLKIGPNWMKNRKPFNIERLMIVYNLIQVIACAYVHYEVG